ncbi:MAG TPA: acyl-CoA thioesterase [Burkholderiaceae bacterium]|nr:acyl-CoA thioesterase [Burkholderiaceae bacterium]
MDLRAQINEKAKSGAGRALRLEMPVRWGDLDALNHVNNTVYFRYMEEARMHYATACGLTGANAGRDIVLASVTCDFLRPILWPATVVVDTRLVRVGRSSLECTVEITVQGEEAPSARGTSIVVGIDPATSRSSPWTETELQGMARVFLAAA